ncbi:Cof-type HAD-IIB family hydrolase [Lichenicoccus sp.]|uniref:Cof-type HAD-IIB family hydrolase n=1 Tax=Lichenicoccus sp. TaxID=2781899 RepID=UPI003D12DF3F
MSGLVEKRAGASPRIRLLVSDIDGTLVTSAKQVTPRALRAVQALREAGVRLALVSSRSARGMDMFIGPLAIDTPRAGLNGGEILDPDGRVIAQIALDPDAARRVVEALDEHHVEAWLFAGGEWLVRNAQGAYVEKERRAVQIEPTLVSDFEGHYHHVGKIMGSTADSHLLERVEINLQTMLGDQVNAHRSQLYYLDVTHPAANKGNAALRLAELLGVSADEMACIGDMSNDIAMLNVAGLAIAMGNATEEVAQAAHYVTASNEQDGWARAVEELILPRSKGTLP